MAASPSGSRDARALRDRAAHARRRREPHPRAADHMLEAAADATVLGTPSTRRRGYFGAEGEEPGTRSRPVLRRRRARAQPRCIGCGGCMVGCRYNAKNTLDKNYLYFAEKRGAQSSPRPASSTSPARRRARWHRGYELSTERSTAWLKRADDASPPRRGVRRLRARHDGPALPPQAAGSLPAVSDSSAMTSGRTPSRSSACGSRAARTTCRRASQSAPASTSISTRTSRPRATARLRRHGAAGHIAHRLDGPAVRAFCSWLEDLCTPCYAIPSALCAACIPSAGRASP